MVLTRPGSNTDKIDGSNVTKVGLSTQVIIRVNGAAIGAIQNITVTETRPITMVQEVGTDGNIDSSPTKSVDISGSCKRIRFDRIRVSEAFGRGFLHAHSQRIPFDIDIYDYWGGNETSPIITVIKNVWIKSLSYSYSVDNWIVFDDMQWTAEAISSTLNSGSAANGGTRGIALDKNNDEIAADIGTTRGALSAVDLIGAVFT